MFSGFFIYNCICNKTGGIRKFDFTILIEMKRILLFALLLSALLFSCAKGITPYEAAHGKAKCGRYLK